MKPINISSLIKKYGPGIELLVDTGADVTTVPSHLLPVLEFKKNKLPVNITFGLGGFSIKTWEFQTYLRIGKIS